MRIVSWNVNGLRSLVRRDFDAWLQANDFDVLCLQEVKVEEDLLTSRWFAGYEAYWNPSRRPGQSGVATLVRAGLVASSCTRGIGHAASDDEGRVLTLDVGDLRIVNVYAPHSHRKLTRLDAKMAFLDQFARFVERQRQPDRNLVLLGDFNIAHKEIDLANPRANMKNAGFLPDERAWMDEFLSNGFVDAFRAFEQGAGHYSWWSMREGVRERNVGWRLDYAIVEQRLAPRLKDCSMIPERTGSDHCPVVVQL